MNNYEFLTVETQPKQNFHFRYIKELNGNTHGPLSGHDDDFPRIRLTLSSDLDNYGKKRDFFVLCSLHYYDNQVLSPHLLMPKGDTRVNYRFIFQKMDEVINNSAERVWCLREYVIVRLLKNQYRLSLQNKQMQYQDLELPFDFKELLGSLDLENDSSINESGKLNVCLGFTIFEWDSHNKTHKLFRNTLFSKNIYNGDDLKINRICNIKGSILGGSEVTILIRHERNYPIYIVITKIDNNSKETLWSKDVKIEKNNSFENAAITFTMPAYKGPSRSEEEIEVILFVRVGATTYKSDNCKFYYINEKRKRPRNIKDDEHIHYVRIPNEEVSRDSLTETQLRNVGNKRENVKKNKSIDKIFGNLDYDNNSMESVFYDALESTNTLIHLYITAKTSNKQHLVADFYNRNNENLLHWACKTNNFWSIRPLIGLGCHINEQDIMGRTPLHVALAAKNTDCIKEIQKLLNNYTNYPKEVLQDLIKMSEAYNHNGYTVLHEAIIAKNIELFKLMLAFLKKHEINVLDYEVLGTGDSVVHLIAKNNLIEMMSLIKKDIPNYLCIKNYAGLTINDSKQYSSNSDDLESDDIDLDDIESSEMRSEKLKSLARLEN